MDIKERSTRAWQGNIDDTKTENLNTADNQIYEITDRIAFVHSFANVAVVDVGETITMVDTGGYGLAKKVHAAVRSWSKKDLEVAIYSHGHIDHVFGVPVFQANQSRPITVIAHENLKHRFDRYIESAGFNEIINKRQFQNHKFVWPKDFRYPDREYRQTLELKVGDTDIALSHSKGETDDHTMSWFPESKMLACGDLFTWVSPNAGNPQKVQRYPKEWAESLIEMAQIGAELLIPGHGLPLFGAERIKTTLLNSAELLGSIVSQTLAMMNEGLILSEIIKTLRPPSHLLELPYLKPIYDEPEFIIRAVWRKYGGWYEGEPGDLKPPSLDALSFELLSQIQSIDAFLDRAEELSYKADDQSMRIACQMIDIAFNSLKESQKVADLRASIYLRRSERELSLMAKGIYTWAVREATDRSQTLQNKSSTQLDHL
ncbi:MULTISPECIES: alkyl sulfatase dimerization domain-containing protein [Acidithrix]|uniref:Metallo-beta-lactamase superfamily protein n=1 Tax=Acidithrix ferrooxidans TaxID=1280514 RepID=A0A0D8HM84_9ACTN|nr:MULTISPECIES: alkyl sulfatase dimerization domain-containing protein [Acidithrix]KJF18201.1 metallo-beta-lactamase superfamily protein [Acidithrix ferrooxidans]CAG4899881.1 unnamed protein product [Acidithrix sp. C25]